MIPFNNNNIFLRLYDNFEQIIELNDNINYDEYILIGNEQNTIFDKNNDNNKIIDNINNKKK